MLSKRVTPRTLSKGEKNGKGKYRGERQRYGLYGGPDLFSSPLPCTSPTISPPRSGSDLSWFPKEAGTALAALSSSKSRAAPPSPNWGLRTPILTGRKKLAIGQSTPTAHGRLEQQTPSRSTLLGLPSTPFPSELKRYSPDSLRALFRLQARHDVARPVPRRPTRTMCMRRPPYLTWKTPAMASLHLSSRNRHPPQMPGSACHACHKSSPSSDGAWAL